MGWLAENCSKTNVIAEKKLKTLSVTFNGPSPVSVASVKVMLNLGAEKHGKCVRKAWVFQGLEQTGLGFNL